MSDFLLEMGKNPQVRQLVKTLGLPIPMPLDLKREKGSYTERPLAEASIALGIPYASELTTQLAQDLMRAGANPFVHTTEEIFALFAQEGEAFGRHPERLILETYDTSQTFDAMVFDATTLRTTDSLEQLYAFFHPLLRSLNKHGRIVILGRPPEETTLAPHRAAQTALEGFVRSLAKEIGKKGSTAQLLYVSTGAEAQLEAPLRFFLSKRSAYITGQPLRIAPVENQHPKTWTLPLEGKIALVTGAARGIGAMTARRLAEEGAKVICLDRPQDDAPTSQLARDIDGDVFLADITAEDTPQRLCEMLKERFGGVDIVVHNAGITRDKTLARMKREHWAQTIDVNLSAVSRVTHALINDVLRKDGRLICLSSIAGIAGNMGQTNYASAKSGIIGLVRHMSAELQDKGITVNAIAPGFIETRMTEAIPFAIREVARRMNNLGQGGRPLDVAEAITFLATPQASGLTGQVLRVCGGSLIGA